MRTISLTMVNIDETVSSVVQVHIPTNDEEKDNATPTLGLVLVIADGNAKAGVGNMEANGERFLYNSPFLNI